MLHNFIENISLDAESHLVAKKSMTIIFDLNFGVLLKKLLVSLGRENLRHIGDAHYVKVYGTIASG